MITAQKYAMLKAMTRGDSLLHYKPLPGWGGSEHWTLSGKWAKGFMCQRLFDEHWIAWHLALQEYVVTDQGLDAIVEYEASHKRECAEDTIASYREALKIKEQKNAEWWAKQREHKKPAYKAVCLKCGYGSEESHEDWPGPRCPRCGYFHDSTAERKKRAAEHSWELLYGLIEAVEALQDAMAGLRDTPELLESTRAALQKAKATIAASEKTPE
jgi:hypothetical protein